jgi:hypothetical protein
MDATRFEQSRSGFWGAALLAALLAGAAPGRAADGDAGVARFAWLAGCWALDAAEPGSGEQWMMPAGGTMLGAGRTVKGGQTVSFEFMQLRVQPDGVVAFIAQPSGRPPTAFPLLRAGEREAVFENPQHDFPRRVMYARQGERLQARIEGTRNGVARGIDFAMVRTACP